MATRLLRMLLVTLTAYLVWPALILAGSPQVLVNPHVQGRGNATTFQEGISIVATIQGGIAMVDPGGKVMVLPGTYDEAIVVDKGLILEASGLVVIAPPKAPGGALTIAIRVATPEPVTIRDATVEFTNANGGILGEGVVDVTVERARLTAVDPLPGAGFLVAVSNNAPTTGRARLSVRES